MKFHLFLATLLCSSLIWSQSINKAKLDSLFDLLETENQAMGSVSVFYGDEEIYSRAFGYLALEPQVKANPTTKYRIGSISKTFTATIIMQMVAEEKLSLGDKLSGFFPELEDAGEITIRQMLNHSSGIHNFTNEKKYRDYMTEPKDREAKLKIIEKLDMDFEPGSKHQYSNTNYVLLSLIAEDIDGKSFAEVLQNRIASPLKLQNTYYGDGLDIEKNEARSYGWDGYWSKSTETHLSIPMGAGAVVSTPTDLNRFFQALFHGKLLPKEMVDEMSEIEEGFGYGLFSYAYKDTTISSVMLGKSKSSFGHTGGIDAFHSMASYFPEENLSLAICLNGEQYPMNDILRALLQSYFKNDFKLPSFETLELSIEELEQYIGTYGASTFPLKVTVSVKNGILMGQASGQPPFPLEAFEEQKFRFRRAGLEIHFSPEGQQLTLLQNGGSYVLKKE